MVAKRALRPAIKPQPQFRPLRDTGEPPPKILCRAVITGTIERNCNHSDQCPLRIFPEHLPPDQSSIEGRAKVNTKIDTKRACAERFVSMKWLFRLLSFVIVMAMVAIGAIVTMPKDRMARIASDQLSAQLGRRVDISGDISFRFYPVVGVSTGPITIANADWAGDTPMFRAQSAQIALEALPLLRREVRVIGLIANSPDVLLQQDAQGRANWVFDAVNTAAEADTTAGALPPFTIEKLDIRNGAVRYEETGQAPISYRNVDLSLSWPDQGGPAEASLILRPAGEDVTITATLAKPLSFLAGGAHPVSATLHTKGGSASFNGLAGVTPEAQGKLSADLKSTNQFMQSLGLGSVDLPRGLGQAIRLSSAVTYEPKAQKLSLNALSATLDQNAVTGATSVILSGAKPRVDARLKAGALDLTGLTGGSSTPKSAGSGWSTTPIDASGLGALDGAIALDAASIDLGTVNFGAARLRITIDRSRAVFGIQEMLGYQGVFSGEFVMNNRSGLSVGGKLRARGVEAKDLLTDLAGVERLSGRANASLNFLGVGQSIDQIMKSLRGDGDFTFGRGVITGIDLDQLMRSGGGAGGTTIFDSLAASYKIDKGVMRNKDLLLSLPILRATGEGRVNLGKQTLDYTFTPKFLGTETRKGLAIPVQIKGPWSDPRVTADLEKAIDLNFKEEKEEVEDEIRKRIGEEIGVEIEEKDSVEDIIKKKVEDEILKGIGDLLGGN